MKSSLTGRFNLHSLTSPAVSWAAALLLAVLIGGRWFRPTDASAWNALALTAVVTLAWQQTRSRARRRLHAALDAYAEREIRQEELLSPRTAENPAAAG